MKKQAFFLLTVFLVILSGKLISQPSIVTSTVPLYQDGRLYLKIKAASSVVVKTKDTILNDPGGSFHSLFTKYQVTRTERPFTGLTAGLDKTYRISFTQPTRIDSFLLELSQISSAVDYAEKVPAVYTFSVPNDSMYAAAPVVQYYLALLNSNLASNVHVANGNAVVAIVDDAILTSHHDLTGNIGSSATTWTDVADADNDPNPPLAAGNASNFTHGTHVAGIAGARTNNGIGIASIGWNNQLMCVKATPDAAPGTTITNGYDGLFWAATHGAHVINLSWGGYAFSQTDYSVVVAAKSHDVVIVAAAGNNNSISPAYPAAYGEGTTGQPWEAIDHRLVVAVAALDQSSNRSVWSLLGSVGGVPFYSGSNFGQWVDICAYGTNILSTLAASTSTGGALTNQYGQLSGTSMAAPMVSGIAGVMRSYDMTKTADQIIDCLLSTANPDIYNSTHPSNQAGMLGSGRADAWAALRCLSSTCSVSPIAIIVPSSQSLCPSATVTLTANQGSGYLWSTGATVQSITVSTTGVYNVTVSYAGGCSATASINIPNADLTAHVDILENSGLYAGDGIVCGTAGIQLYAHSGSSYQWGPFPGAGPLSPGGGGIWGPPNPNSLPYTATESITITDVGGCAGVTGTASVLMQWMPLPTITIASVNTLVCPGTAVTLTASGASSYTWIATTPWPSLTPTGITSTNNPYIATPSQDLTYSVTGMDSNGCYGTQTLGIAIASPYASPWVTFALSSPLSGTYSSLGTSPLASHVITSDVSISGVTTFSNSDVLFAPGVKITVPASSTLNILGSHLHTCHNDMWQGIVVQDGGALYIDEITGVNSTLIEDAVAAIDISNNTTSTLSSILTVSNTIFNKNYTGINVTNYPVSAPSYSNAIQVHDCVFTCRDLAFTNTVWPSPAASSSLGLRYTTSTTGIAPPYLGSGSYSITTIKAPYTGQPSHSAIFLNGVGTATSSITIGDDSNAGNFNVFDNHVVFVNAQNSNVILKNNVFQNQVHAAVPPVNVSISPGTGLTAFGWSNNSAAIMHRTFNATLTTQMDLTASSVNVGNRFWNCVRAIEGYNMAVFKMSNALARSTHTADGQNIIGASGLNLNTNRVNYDIHDNEFTNIKNAINVPLTAGFLTGYSVGGSPAYGNYLTALSIYNNTFSAGTPTNGNFMSQAVNVTNALGVSPNSPSTLPALTPLLPNYGWVNNPGYPSDIHPTGLGIIGNTITGAWNGINVNGFNGFPVWVAQNTLTLVDHTVTSQYGIQLENGTSNTPAQQNVWQNSVQGAGNDGTDMSLIYCSLNSGSVSPLITCNDVKDATKGFVFAGNNTGTLSLPGTQWLGNSMESLQSGMYLSGYVTTGGSTLEGIIGAQGDTYVAMGNQWNGTWAGVNYNIFTYNSTATNSPLSTLTPTTSFYLWGNPGNVSYADPSQINAIVQTTHNDFFCNFTQYDVQPNPGPVGPIHTGTLQAYQIKEQAYHFLRNNSGLLDANPDLAGWYSDVTSNSNLGALEVVQENLFAGNYSGALTSLSSMTAANYVEQNSIDFYGLYANYVKSVATGTAYTSTDSLSLVGMTQLCPLEYGASIYKARALYNTLYNIQVNAENCGAGGGGARLASNAQSEATNTQRGTNNLLANRSIAIYPNPAGSQLTINSSGEKDELFIRILDLTGRPVLSKKVKTENFTSSLDLDLINGAYMITITNGKDQVLTTKLLIAK